MKRKRAHRKRKRSANAQILEDVGIFSPWQAITYMPGIFPALLLASGSWQGTANSYLNARTQKWLFKLCINA